MSTRNRRIHDASTDARKIQPEPQSWARVDATPTPMTTTARDDARCDDDARRARAYVSRWAARDAASARGTTPKAMRMALGAVDDGVAHRAFVDAVKTLAREDAKEAKDGTRVRLVCERTTTEANGMGRRVTRRVAREAEADERVAGAVKTTASGGDEACAMVYEDEQRIKREMYDAPNEEMNAFRENKYGTVTCETATRNAERGRRGASDARAANGTAVKTNGASKASVAGTPAVATPKEGGATAAGGSAAKQKDAGAKKNHSLMSMFANAPKPKAKAATTSEAPKRAAVAEVKKEKAPTPKKKAPASAEAAILAAEEDESDDDDSDDEIGGAKRKPRKKRAITIESEDEEEDEEEDMEIVDDEPEPEPTPKSTPKKTPKSTPKKKTPKSTPKKTPPSSKRKTPSTPSNDENDENASDVAPSEPNSRPQSASKKHKKEKPLSKKALLARRIKKTVEEMDEETGEEIMRTFFVDEFDNELNEDGTYKDPDNVKTATA
jgi:hypothetical protein